jgi:hypothetical protein
MPLYSHIFTTMGQEVHHDSKTITSPGSIEFEWDGSGATDGVYFYSAVFQNKRMTGKIIKGK